MAIRVTDRAVGSTQDTVTDFNFPRCGDYRTTKSAVATNLNRCSALCRYETASIDSDGIGPFRGTERAPIPDSYRCRWMLAKNDQSVERSFCTNFNIPPGRKQAANDCMEGFPEFSRVPRYDERDDIA